MDLHSQIILDEYREALPVFGRMQTEVQAKPYQNGGKSGWKVGAQGG